MLDEEFKQSMINSNKDICTRLTNIESLVSSHIQNANDIKKVSRKMKILQYIFVPITSGGLFTIFIDKIINR